MESKISIVNEKFSLQQFLEAVMFIYYAKKYLYEDYTDWNFDYGDHGYETDDGVPSNLYSKY